MRNHGVIVPAFWTRGTGKRLRGHKEAQLVAVYLMSCPAASMVGIFPLSLPQLCNDTGLTLEEARKGLKKCEQEGFAFYDVEDELFWVPRLAAIQVGEELTACGKNSKPDRRIQGIRRALQSFKGHLFYNKFLEIYGAPYHLDDLKPEAATKPLQRGYDPVAVVDPDPVTAEGVQGETAPSARIPCPLDLALPADAVANYEMTAGVPAWATALVTRDFVLKWSATPGDKRFRDQWVRSLSSAVLGDWRDHAKRQKLRQEHESMGEDHDQALAQRAADRQRADAADRERARQALRGAAPTPTTETQARAALDALTQGGSP